MPGTNVAVPIIQVFQESKSTSAIDEMLAQYADTIQASESTDAPLCIGGVGVVTRGLIPYVQCFTNVSSSFANVFVTACRWSIVFNLLSLLYPLRAIYISAYVAAQNGGDW